MQIKDILQQYELPFTKTKAKSERAEILSKIIDRLEDERKLSGYKPLGAGFYAMKMAQIGIKTTQDFYWFDGYLKESKSYCATWWWYIREKIKK